MNPRWQPPTRGGRAAIRFLMLGLVAFALSGWAAEPYWIDVRSAEEYAGDHLAGAVNIPYTEIVERIGEVTERKDAEILVYCHSGRRAGIAQQALGEAGYTNVRNIGGLEDARAAAVRLADCTIQPLSDCLGPAN